MNYLKHQNEFGEDFNIKLKELERLIRGIYKVRDENEFKSKNSQIRLHSSTLDASSSFACISSILENKITMGETVKDYENSYASFLGNTHKVLSCNSGSSANLLAISTLCQSGKLKKGDKVIVPALSWSTTVFPLVQYGLIPIFCDCNDLDFNISIDKFEKLIKDQKPKALMLIHTYGCPADMDVIKNLCDSYNLILVEDTCESMGAEWDKKKAGTFGDISTFSSYYSHHICTLEGGLTCFKEESDKQIAESIRSHGWIRHLNEDNQIIKNNKNLDPAFIFNYVGYNIRLSEPQAAIGLEQLKKLNTFILNRRKSAKRYTSFFEDYQDIFKYIKPLPKAYSSWFGFPLVLTGKLAGKRKKLRELLLKNSIESRPFLAGDFTMQPVVKSFKHYKSENLEVSSSIASDGLAIPCHQNISEENISKVLSLFKNFINKEITK